MSYPKHTKLGLIDVNAFFASGKPLTRAQLRQLSFAGNTLTLSDIPGYHQPFLDNDVEAVNDRTDDAKENFYNLVSKTWNVAPPYWEQASQVIRLLYPPGYTKAEIKIRMGLMTNATLRLRAQTSATFGDYSDQSTNGQIQLEGRTDYDKYTLELPLDPSGEDFLVWSHRTTAVGDEYTDATYVGDFSHEINRSDWFNDEDYSQLAIDDARDADGNIYASPVDSTYQGENFEDLGAIVLVYDTLGRVVWGMKRIALLLGNESNAGKDIAIRAILDPVPTRQEIIKLPSPITIKAYESAVYAISGYGIKLSVGTAYE